jgi:hypothetical protein
LTYLSIYLTVLHMIGRSKMNERLHEMTRHDINRVIIKIIRA